MSRGQIHGVYGATEPQSVQRQAFRSGEFPVAIYGLGKMGVPLACVFAETTGAVTGVDVDTAVVDSITRGECHVEGEPGLSDLVADQVGRGRLGATTDSHQAATAATIHVIIVPTLLSADGEPDLDAVESVVNDIAHGLAPGDLVIVESTVPPGTCRDVIEPHLVAQSGLSRDEFGVAFCPERTASGRALRDIRGAYPKVVGGVDDESARAATLVYDVLTDNEVHVVRDASTAEAVKIFEGVYRDVNIALANELARIGDDLDISVREAIETANRTPMCHIHDPGPGVGGHCIPFYPHFLLSTTEEPMELTRTARTVNEAMPAVTVDVLERELDRGGAATDGFATEGTDIADASILVLGITYRSGVAETRSAPALEVIELLEERGANVTAIDPLVDPGEFGIDSLTIDEIGRESFDAAVLVTPQTEFNEIDWTELDPMVVLDGRDALDLGETHHRVHTLGGSENGRPRIVRELIEERSQPIPSMVSDE